MCTTTLAHDVKCAIVASSLKILAWGSTVTLSQYFLYGLIVLFLSCCSIYNTILILAGLSGRKLDVALAFWRRFASVFKYPGTRGSSCLPLNSQWDCLRNWKSILVYLTQFINTQAISADRQGRPGLNIKQKRVNKRAETTEQPPAAYSWAVGNNRTSQSLYQRRSAGMLVSHCLPFR